MEVLSPVAHALAAFFVELSSKKPTPLWDAHIPPGIWAMAVCDRGVSDRYLDEFIERFIGLRPGYLVAGTPVTQQELRDALYNIVKAEEERPRFKDRDHWLFDFDGPRFKRYARTAMRNEIIHLREDGSSSPEEEVVSDPPDPDILLGHATKAPGNAPGRRLKTSSLHPQYGAIQGVLIDLSTNGTAQDRCFARLMLEKRYEIEDLSREFGSQKVQDFQRKVALRLKQYLKES